MQMNFQIDNIDIAVWLIVNSPEYISRNIACLVFTFDLYSRLSLPYAI